MGRRPGSRPHGHASIQGRVVASRAKAVYDTTIGWRFVNPRMKARHGVDSMPETAENVVSEFHIERQAQDRMAWPASSRPWRCGAALQPRVRRMPPPIGPDQACNAVNLTRTHPHAPLLDVVLRGRRGARLDPAAP